jgi:hypothetical protein
MPDAKSFPKMENIKAVYSLADLRELLFDEKS